MKKIILLIALTLTMSTAALAGCNSGTADKLNTAVPDNTQQITLDERTKIAKDNNDKDCDNEHCKNEREGENRREPDFDEGETDENKIPEHRHRPPHGPRKGHGHRPHPRPMPRQYR